MTDDNQQALEDSMLLDASDYDLVDGEDEVATPEPTTPLVAPVAVAKATPDVDLAEQPFTWKTLNAIANTEFVPAGYRGAPDKMLGAILYGRESNLGPMTSLQMIDMVDGKPSMSAELMVSLVRRAGHHLIAAEDWSGATCTAIGTRADNGDTMFFTFDIDMAQSAGLVRKGSAWERYPHAMLWNRASSQLIRVLFPDVLISMHSYEPDELTP